jgi:hypothetical protein
MFFSGQNLLYTFHQSLTAQHITVAAFKRYARSPENRTFTNYFRKTNPFSKYMRQRPQNSLSRYITKHRRKKNPILTTFTTRITTAILEKLQQLKIHLSGLRSHASKRMTQNKPIQAQRWLNVIVSAETRPPPGPNRGKLAEIGSSGSNFIAKTGRKQYDMALKYKKHTILGD